jgi:hypothetical protein
MRSPQIVQEPRLGGVAKRRIPTVQRFWHQPVYRNGIQEARTRQTRTHTLSIVRKPSCYNIVHLGSHDRILRRIASGASPCDEVSLSSCFVSPCQTLFNRPNLNFQFALIVSVGFVKFSTECHNANSGVQFARLRDVAVAYKKCRKHSIAGDSSVAFSIRSSKERLCLTTVCKALKELAAAPASCTISFCCTACGIQLVSRGRHMGVQTPVKRVVVITGASDLCGL